MDPDSICMQYKATHPLWGLQTQSPWKVPIPIPNPFTQSVREKLLADFRTRYSITPEAWDVLLGVLVYELREDLGVDSYFAIGFEGEFPEWHDYAGCTLPQVLRGLRVQVALVNRDK